MDDQALPPKQTDEPNYAEGAVGDLVVSHAEAGQTIQPDAPPTAPTLPSDAAPEPPEAMPPIVPPEPEQPPMPQAPVSGQPPQDSTTILEPAVYDNPTAPPPKRAGKPRRLRLWILIAVCALVLIAGGVAALLILSKKTPKNNGPATPAQNDIQLLRYGALDGTMNQFAPTLQNNPATLYMNKQVFEPLVGYESGVKIVPILVTGWTNPDATTWVFNLRSGVRFHTGNTLTAKDVVYSWQQYKNNPAFVSTVTSTIKNVEAPADDQVKITTNGTDPLLLNRLANLLIIDSSAGGKVDPVYGTGPYQVKPGTTPDADHIDLIAFDNFHGSHIYTRELQVTVYRAVASEAVTGQAAALRDLKAGKLDLIGQLSGNTLTDAAAANYARLNIDNPTVFYLIPNTLQKGSPLSSPKVRQAIMNALDVDAVMKAQNVTGETQSQLVAKYIPGYNQSVTRPKVDPDAARRLLRDGGYANGTSFTLTFDTALAPAATEIASQLKNVGITVKLDPKADAAKVQADGAAGRLEAYLSSDASQYNDASDVYARELQSKNYSNPSISSLLSQAAATLNQTDRLNFLQMAAKSASDDVALIPLWNSQQSWVTSDVVLGAGQDLLQTDLGVYFYKTYDK